MRFEKENKRGKGSSNSPLPDPLNLLVELNGIEPSAS